MTVIGVDAHKKSHTLVAVAVAVVGPWRTAVT